jgi:hypothetical protein
LGSDEGERPAKRTCRAAGRLMKGAWKSKEVHTLRSRLEDLQQMMVLKFTALQT